MTIVQLFGEPEGDQVILCEPGFGVRFYLAHVHGVGNCPHQHRLEAKAQACMERMRRFVDFKARRADSGLHVAADGTEFVRLHREGPGRRPSRRPW